MGEKERKEGKKKRKRIVIFLIVNLYRVSEKKKKKLIGQTNRVNEFNGIEFKIEMAD